MGQRRAGSSSAVGRRPADSDAGDAPAPRRGRPQKFGRPSQVVALTLPEEVLDALRSVHRDPGWAIVRLVEPILHQGRRRPLEQPRRAPAELVRLPGGRALIVVEPDLFSGLEGVSTIPLADGRAFLALDHGGLADLEVAINDRLEATATGTAEHQQVREVRDIVRGWRRDRSLVFRAKSIIVAEGAVDAGTRSLAPFDAVGRHPRTPGQPRGRT